jgi:hypothetical protein
MKAHIIEWTTTGCSTTTISRRTTVLTTYTITPRRPQIP